MMSSKKFAFLFFIVMGLAACNSDDSSNLPTSKNPGFENNVNGTSDGGGGDIDFSTPEEIKMAVEDTRNIILDSDFPHLFLNRKVLSKVKYKYGKGIPELFAASVQLEATLVRQLVQNELPRWAREAKTQNDITAIEKEIEIIENGYGIDPWVGVQLSDGFNTYTENYSHVNRDYINGIEVFYLKDKPCPSINNQHADASVTEYSRNAKICFSLLNLRRIPPSSLKEHVFALWMHELVHMSGEEDENKAQTIEYMAIEAYSVLRSHNTEGLLLHTYRTIREAHSPIYIQRGAFDNFDSLSAEQRTRQISKSRAKFSQSKFLVSQFIRLFDETLWNPNLFPSIPYEGKRQEFVTEAMDIRQMIEEVLSTQDEEYVSHENLKRIRTVDSNLEQLAKEFETTYEVNRDSFEDEWTITELGL